MQFRPIDSIPRRADGLDTLRSLAIVLVFAYHYMVFVSHAPTFGWVSEIGWVGVDLFFVLSGYLIANQIFAGLARGSDLSLKAFYARRLLRTLPNYYVLLALYFLFPSVMGGNAPPPLWTFLTFTQNILLQPGTAFSHAWSLCVEEQFYLLLPAITLLGVHRLRSIRLGWWVLAALMLTAIAIRSVLWSRYGREADGATAADYYQHIYYASWARFDEFLPGVALAMLKNFHPALWRRLTAHGQNTFVAGAAGVVAATALFLKFHVIDGYGFGYFATAFGYSLLATSFALLTLAALSEGSALHRVRVPGAARLAAWSYAIYLSQKPLSFVVQRALDSRGIGADSAAAIAVITLACLIGGWLLYRLVETPFMNLRDRLVPTSFPTLPIGTTGLSFPRSSA